MTDEEFRQWATRMFMAEAEILERQALEQPLTEEEAAWLYSGPEENFEYLERRILERTASEKDKKPGLCAVF